MIESFECIQVQYNIIGHTKRIITYIHNISISLRAVEGEICQREFGRVKAALIVGQ